MAPVCGALVPGRWSLGRQATAAQRDVVSLGGANHGRDSSTLANGPDHPPPHCRRGSAAAWPHRRPKADPGCWAVLPARLLRRRWFTGSRFAAQRRVSRRLSPARGSAVPAARWPAFLPATAARETTPGGDKGNGHHRLFHHRGPIGLPWWRAYPGAAGRFAWHSSSSQTPTGPGRARSLMTAAALRR